MLECVLREIKNNIVFLNIKLCFKEIIFYEIKVFREDELII